MPLPLHRSILAALVTGIFVIASAAAELPPTRTVRQYAEGDSMLPAFPRACSFLMDTSPRAFSRAKRGASIVWRRSDGKLIHHSVRKVFLLNGETVILTESASGHCLDNELVTSANFVGLVVEGTTREESPSVLAAMPSGRKAAAAK